MARIEKISHPSDDVLMSLVDDDEKENDAALGTHAASCHQCAQRIAELRATRRLLQDVAAQEVQPSHDIAQRAIGRLRGRQTAIGNMNEVFTAMRALIRGLVDLFGGGGPPADAPGAVSHPQGVRHG